MLYKLVGSPPKILHSTGRTLTSLNVLCCKHPEVSNSHLNATLPVNLATILLPPPCMLDASKHVVCCTCCALRNTHNDPVMMNPNPHALAPRSLIECPGPPAPHPPPHTLAHSWISP